MSSKDFSCHLSCLAGAPVIQVLFFFQKQPPPLPSKAAATWRKYARFNLRMSRVSAFKTREIPETCNLPRFDAGDTRVKRELKCAYSRCVAAPLRC